MPVKAKPGKKIASLGIPTRYFAITERGVRPQRNRAIRREGDMHRLARDRRKPERIPVRSSMAGANSVDPH
jgi:hypothetical protein